MPGAGRSIFCGGMTDGKLRGGGTSDEVSVLPGRNAAGIVSEWGTTGSADPRQGKTVFAFVSVAENGVPLVRPSQSKSRFVREMTGIVSGIFAVSGCQTAAEAHCSRRSFFLCLQPGCGRRDPAKNLDLGACGAENPRADEVIAETLRKPVETKK